MKTNRLFAPDAAAIDRLVAAHPFAQLVSIDGERPLCTPLPLLLERSGDEAWLVGHFARANPQVELLRQRPRALAVFMGAQGYVSPSWMRDRTQAPTWNYETVHFDVDVGFDEGESQPHAALERLVAHMERDRPQAWSSHDMGARYAQLAEAVVAFRARILATHAKFKLGQNERPDVYADILDGLSRTAQPALRAAMERANPSREPVAS
jgi:transcriptional regulator